MRVETLRISLSYSLITSTLSRKSSVTAFLQETMARGSKVVLRSRVWVTMLQKIACLREIVKKEDGPETCRTGADIFPSILAL